MTKIYDRPTEKFKPQSFIGLIRFLKVEGAEHRVYRPKEYEPIGLLYVFDHTDRPVSEGELQDCRDD